MYGKLVTHPVHYFIKDKSCVCHSTPPPSGKICNHYRFINITPRAAFVKAQFVLLFFVQFVLCYCSLGDESIKKDEPQLVRGLQIWWAIEELNF